MYKDVFDNITELKPISKAGVGTTLYWNVLLVKFGKTQRVFS